MTTATEPQRRVPAAQVDPLLRERLEPKSQRPPLTQLGTTLEQRLSKREPDAPWTPSGMSYVVQELMALRTSQMRVPCSVRDPMFSDLLLLARPQYAVRTLDPVPFDRAHLFCQTTSHEVSPPD